HLDPGVGRACAVEFTRLALRRQRVLSRTQQFGVHRLPPRLCAIWATRDRTRGLDPPVQPDLHLRGGLGVPRRLSPCPGLGCPLARCAGRWRGLCLRALAVGSGRAPSGPVYWGDSSGLGAARLWTWVVTAA